MPKYNDFELDIQRILVAYDNEGRETWSCPSGDSGAGHGHGISSSGGHMDCPQIPD